TPSKRDMYSDIERDQPLLSSDYLRNKFKRSSVLILHYYAHHRDLHSFPTRRSSDLGAASRHIRPRSKHWRREGAASSLRQCFERSEEHTSELQSRGHLVCRLLLEKKKNSSPDMREKF